MKQRRNAPVSGQHAAGLLHHCSAFTRALGRAGIAADPSSTIEFCRALELIDIGNPADFRAAARAIFVHCRDDLPAFEQTFAEYWYGRWQPVARQTTDGDTEVSGSWPRTAQDVQEQALPDSDDDPQALYSNAEILADRDLATLDERQVEQARRLIRQFASAFPAVRTRRFRAVRRGRVPDFRRVLRGLARRGNDDVTLPYRDRSPRRTRLALLCDVSGSMRGYTEFLLELIYGLRRELPVTEIAVFATRLTVISDLLKSRDMEGSLRQVMRTAADWGGGTDIGGCLREFNRKYARTLLSTRSVMVILSDGLDRGDPLLMREEMGQLRRHVSRLIWLNPLLRYADYEPLTRGMRTAMPRLDLFLPCHSIGALAGFARTLRRQWG